ncbi:hypothetical protein GRAN_4044 [Granulicella sibirica]|uniref:Uncharacterized protein n=1 Tax=Granulicella sibirica TaxID=2479048 RepID=A0A4Q0SY75_9BACT|nr:hypothetical protein GRAN_4044 [Granulicella sibirica]
MFRTGLLDGFHVSDSSTAATHSGYASVCAAKRGICTAFGGVNERHSVLFKGGCGWRGR